MDNSVTRLYNLYNNNEYSVLLKEAHSLIDEASPKGKEIYVNIVNKVDVEPFKNIIK